LKVIEQKTKKWWIFNDAWWMEFMKENIVKK
jgi:hypothetical protein